MKIIRISFLKLSHFLQMLFFLFLFFNSFCCCFIIIPLLYFSHSQPLLPLMAALPAEVAVYLLLLLLKTSNMRIVFAVKTCFHRCFFSMLSAYHALKSHFLGFLWIQKRLAFFRLHSLRSFRFFLVRIFNFNNVDFLFRLCN